MAKVAWGIELGTTSVKAVKMTTTKEDVEILDIQIVELPKFDPELEQTYEERLQVALMDLSNQVKMKNDEVFISIPGHQTFNRSIAIPYLDPKKFRETVRFEAKNQFPGQIEESKILWDYQLVTPNPTPGEDVEVLLFAARRDTVSQYIDMCNNAGIKVVGVQISSLAIYNFIRYDQKFGKSGIIVDIGGDVTDLLIIDDIRVWMRTLSQGSVEVTKTLQNRFKIPFDEAEQLKIKAAKSRQAEKIFGIMKPPLRELLSEIQRSLGFYKSQNPDTKLNYMFLMGAGSNLLGLKKFFEQQLQFRVDKVVRLRRIQVGRTTNPEMLQKNITSLPTAIGLALQGLGEASNKINLVPEEVSFKLIEDAKFPRVAMFAFLLILAALAPILRGTPPVTKTILASNKKTEFQNKVKQNESDYAKYQQIRISEGILTKYNSMQGGRNMSIHVENAFLQFMKSNVLANELIAFNSQYRPLKSAESFAAADTKIIDADGNIVDGSDNLVSWDEFYDVYNLLVNSVDVNFDEADVDDDWQLDKTEAANLKPTKPRSRALFKSCSVVNQLLFKFDWKAGERYYWVPSKLDDIRILHSSQSADKAKVDNHIKDNPFESDFADAANTGDRDKIAAQASKIIDKIHMLEPDTNNLPYYWYRPRSYAIQYEIMIPVDVAMEKATIGRGGDLSFSNPEREQSFQLHLEKVRTLIENKLNSILQKTLPLEFTFEIKTTELVGKIDTLNQHITKRPTLENLPLNLYKTLAIAIKVDYLDPKMGKVVWKSPDGKDFRVLVKPEFLKYMRKNALDTKYDYEKSITGDTSTKDKTSNNGRRTFQIYSTGKDNDRLGIVKATYLDSSGIKDQRLISWINGEDETVEYPKSLGIRLIELNFKLDETSEDNKIKNIRDADVIDLFLYQ